MHDTTAHLMPGPSGIGPARFKPFLAVAVLAAAAALTAACGGGSASTAGSSGSGQGRLAHALAFATCMRRHGFANFPDDWSGNVGQLQSAGIDPSSPQVNAALTKCGF